jgi:hypothetical protein
MNQFGPFAVLIGLLAVALAALGATVAWWNQEARRVRRGLRLVLGEEPHALIVAPGRGRGAGFNFSSGTMAVAWDSGGWCLIYRIEELNGMELLVDGHLAARVWRGEARRPLENVGDAERQVLLRLVFDDPHHPDFLLELWSPLDHGLRGALTTAEALEEGNRWIARTESLFRRRPAATSVRVAPRPEPVAPEPQTAAEPATRTSASQQPVAFRPVAPAPPHEPAAAPGVPANQELPFDSAPWDEEAEDDEDIPLLRPDRMRD